MLLFLKSTSRTVHHYQEEEQQYNITQESSIISLTVWRKSLLFNCKGFTVIASNGSLLYRVDNYTGRPHQIVLMDAYGYPIFTIYPPKKLGFANNYWLVYEGEVENNSINSSKKPIFRARKNTSIIKTKPSVLAYVYRGMCCKGFAYTVEGS
ncbi:hypothetical protein CDL12_25933 [Handroanthus impetiginosus]|uniref:Uncharacterized protein n=1 Tax=Handroanthus impetiginosus TaxID=429701 RepID=A0A2G9G8D5_9LAMI|nr:hypothetical protein CDL12_25933 [Handroanthus impetiginosus]